MSHMQPSQIRYEALEIDGQPSAVILVDIPGFDRVRLQFTEQQLMAHIEGQRQLLSLMGHVPTLEAEAGIGPVIEAILNYLDATGCLQLFRNMDIERDEKPYGALVVWGDDGDHDTDVCTAPTLRMAIGQAAIAYQEDRAGDPGAIL